MKLVPTKFWTEYKQDPADPAKMIGIDWVEYGQAGSLDRSKVVDRVSRILNRLHPIDPNNPAIMMAHERANAIRPHYEAWKTGQEVPLNGTPLGAWNAVTPEQAEVLKARGIRTVEEVAVLSDGNLDRIPLPGMRALVTQAQRFIESADQVRSAQFMAEKDQQIAALTDQGKEDKEQIAQLLARVDQLAGMVATLMPAAKEDAGATPKPRKAAAA